MGFSHRSHTYHRGSTPGATQDFLPGGEGPKHPFLAIVQTREYKAGVMEREGPEREGPEEERPRPRVVDKRVSAGGARPQREDTGAQARASTAETPPPVETPTTVEQPGPEDAEARAIAEEVARAPARDWVLNVAVTLANVAATKIDAGRTDEARLAIDALSGIVDAVGERLGDAGPALRQTLAQLRLEFAGRGGGEPAGDR